MAYTTIDKPTDYFNTKLYTGTGSSNAITGVGFQPDWVWLKNRTGAYDHKLFDVIRPSNKFLSSNLTNAEATTSNFSSIDSDGFTVTNNDGAYNLSGNNYASWNWLAGGSASSNTDGSITSSVSANTTAGFSIVSWTETTANSQTIGHGLGKTPAMIITKLRDDSALDWYTFHQSLGTGNRVMLNSTSAKVSSGFFNGTLDSNVFHVGYGDSYDNKSAIAYCFAEIKGYSKFGSYTGNGNTDGTFVYTGFKPSLVIYKRTDSGADWHMYDNKRDPFNEMDLCLFPSGSFADSPGDDLDFLSNGFKQRNTGAEANASGGSYFYMAFAESPFVSSTGIPTTAR